MFDCNFQCMLQCPQTRYWIPVLGIYWSILTSMAFQLILVQYKYFYRNSNLFFNITISISKRNQRPKIWVFHCFEKISLQEVHSYQHFSCQLSNFLPEMPNCLHYWTKCYSCPKQIGSLCFGVLWIAFHNNNLTHASLIWCY